MIKANNKKEVESNKEFAELLREREDDDKINDSLKAIYQGESLFDNSERKKTGAGSFKKKSLSPWKKISSALLALLLLISTISWVGFFLLHTGSRLNTDDIEFEISGPSEVVAGQEQIYEIKYKNLSNFNLQDVEIYLAAPQNFIITDSAPAVSDKKDTWKFDQIEIKRSGRLSVKAKVIGKVDEKIKLTAVISYRPENFSSTFSSEAGFETKVASTGINAEIEMPSFLNLNEESVFKVKYSKEKENYLNNFSVVFEHGENFEISGENKQGVWEIEDAPETQKVLEIKGKYNKKPLAEEKLTIKLAVPHDVLVEKREGDNIIMETKTVYSVFYENEIMPVVVEGALSMTLTVNSSGSNKPVNFSDTLNYVVHYKNTSDTELKNVIIMAVIDSSAVDWATLVDENKAERKDNSLVWTKSEISSLASVSPDEENSFGFSIKVKSKEALQAAALNDLAVKSYVNYSVDSAINSTSAHAAEIINKINSDVNFTAELRYFDRNNISVGDGPLPPKVGEKTTYQAYLYVKNSLHNLENAAVTLILPEGTRWEGSNMVSNGSMSYNDSGREIKWDIGSIDAIGEPAFAQFAVSITPTESDKNKIVTILNQARLEARDSETGGIIVNESKAKTSNLEDDETGKGYGKVE